MAKSPPPIVYILLGLLLIGGGYQLLRSGRLPFRIPQVDRSTFSAGDPSRQQEILSSQGETVLFPTVAGDAKQAAAALIQAGNRAAALTVLEGIILSEPNDPESRIYFHNLRAQQQGNPYTLAVVVPVSSNPDRAQETLRGVAMAQQHANRLQIAIVDDGDDPEQAAAVATTIVNQPEILGVIGHNSSGASLAAAPIYLDAGLIMISSTSTSTALSPLGEAIFRVVPTDQVAGTQLARYILNTLQRKRVAIFYAPDSNYSTSLRTAFATTLATEGGEVITEVDLEAADFSAGDALQQARDQGAEVVFLAPHGATAAQAHEVARANAASSSPLPMVGGDVLFSFTTLQQGAVVEDLVVAIPWHPLVPAYQNFANRAAQEWGGQVSWRTALAYDATQVLLSGLTTNPDPTRQQLLEFLNQGFTPLQGASGTVRFLPSGDRDGANVLVQVQPGSLSGTGYDFVPLP
jgi:branched-chain amino acid transport system substrate-binding protein